MRTTRNIFRALTAGLVAVAGIGVAPTPTRVHALAGTTVISFAANDRAHGGAGAMESVIARQGNFIAMQSAASNLVQGDTNGVPDVFVIDVSTGAIERVSVSTTGQQLSTESSVPAISDDGRFVLFTTASAAVPQDINNRRDVYRRDRLTGATELISRRTDGSQFPEGGSDGSISANGLVASFAGYELDGFGRITDNIFVRNTVSGVTTLATPGKTDFDSPITDERSDIAADGSSVLVSRLLTATTSHIYRFVLTTGTFTKLSPGSTGVNEGGRRPMGSADGSAVLWISNVGVIMLRSGIVEPIDVGVGGASANGRPSAARFAGASNNVIFASTASNLVAGDTPGSDIFLRTTARPPTTTILSSTFAPGTFNVVPGNAGSLLPSMSADGSRLAMVSVATNFVTDADNSTPNLFLKNMTTGAYTMLNRASSTVVAHGVSARSSLSADGRFVAYDSTAADLTVANDVNNQADTFLLDRQTGKTVRVSVPGTGGAPTAGGTSPDVADNGRRVVFLSAADVTAFPTNGIQQAYLRDLDADTTVLISGQPNGTPASFPAQGARISGDGRFVVFSTRADGLVAGDTNLTADVFVRDLQTNVTTQVNLTNSGLPATGADPLRSTLQPSISTDGRFVSFTTSATNLVAGTTTVTDRVYVRDRVAGTTTLVGAGDGSSVSNDGRFVALSSYIALVASDTNARSDVYRFDRTTGAFAIVSRPTGTGQSNNDSAEATITANGQFVVFRSSATNLVSGDSNATIDVFIRDFSAATTTRVSVTGVGGEVNGVSTEPTISANGQIVTFSSLASNGVSGDLNGFSDVFLRQIV